MNTIWKVKLALIFLLSISLPLLGQTDKSQKALLKEILANKDYIVGRGHGSTLRQAQENALADLAGQISTTVSSQFDYLMNQKTEGKDITAFTQQVNSIVKTYSHTTLRNALEIIVKDEPEADVVRYIKAVDVDKVFEDRKNKALTYAKNAETFDAGGKVGDALSYYYWALTLLRSCPDGDKMKISFGLNNEQQLQSYLYKKMKECCSNIKVQVVSNTLEDDDTQTIVLKVDYKGQPAVNFNYTYYNGERRSGLSTLQNGEDVISIPAKVNLSKLDLRAEYCCEEEANMDSELRDVLNNTQQAPLEIAKMKLFGIKEVKAMKATEVEGGVTIAASAPLVPNNSNETVGGGTAVKYLDATEAAPYLATMTQIEKALRARSYIGIRNLFTDEGYKMFEKLISYGNARLVRSPDVRFSRFRGEVTCRSFPMSFSFKTNRRTFSENVVFRLNSEAKISEVAFGLEERATNDIMNNNTKRYSEEARQVLVNFLESYKTAYALGRIDYFEKVFSNDALIITGTVVIQTGLGDAKPKEQRHVKYTRQTKAQYLRNLQRTIMSNEFINIHFADNIINKSTGKEIYGIQIKQDYFSSSYGDTGYLFLLIDLEKVDEPTVKVRAWQPDLDPTILDGRLNIADFIL